MDDDGVTLIGGVPAVWINGRWVPVPRGGADGDDGGDGGAGDGDGSGQGDGADGGDGDSLLDGGDAGGAGDGGDGGGDDDDTARFTAMEERLAARFESTLDRRISQLTERLDRRTKAGNKNGKGDDDDDTGTQQPVADQRTTRFAFREYVTDEIKFLGSDERAFAMDMGNALIAQRAVKGFDDEDRVGREVASEVATRVKGMRRFYERQTKEALKRKGLLKEEPGQPGKGGNTTGAESEFDKGAAMARDAFADRRASASQKG